jgi:hypothetical protein
MEEKKPGMVRYLGAHKRFGYPVAVFEYKGYIPFSDDEREWCMSIPSLQTRIDNGKKYNCDTSVEEYAMKILQEMNENGE